jgi:galactokinase
MKQFTGTLETVFREKFGSRPDRVIVRSPGRVNLIGEHTDYNQGYVLPAAVDKVVMFIVAPRSDGMVRLYAADLKDQHAVHIDSIERSGKEWPNYLLGVIEELKKLSAGVKGCDVVFGGDIPIGAGLSSSAAVECGFAYALNILFRLGLAALELAKLGQRAENNFVGVQCGIMDQFVNIFGKNQKVLKIDCRSLEFEYIPFESNDLSIVLCETEARRSLASSEYNIRRQQCEDGVRILHKRNPDIVSLRDVGLEFLEYHRVELDPVIFRRCKYVVEENQRVLDACMDLRRNDFKSFGERMYQSHHGLSQGYQVSSPDLDFLVEAASSVDGVLGARMMGAGFGGCTINLVEKAKVETFVETILERSRQRAGKASNVYVTQIQSGTTQLAIATG